MVEQSRVHEGSSLGEVGWERFVEMVNFSIGLEQKMLNCK